MSTVTAERKIISLMRDSNSRLVHQLLTNARRSQLLLYMHNSFYTIPLISYIFLKVFFHQHEPEATLSAANLFNFMVCLLNIQEATRIS